MMQRNAEKCVYICACVCKSKYEEINAFTLKVSENKFNAP